MTHPSERAAAIVAAARACVGTRFRLQGRDAEFGLDCVGLVAKAYAMAGAAPVLPQGYALRGGSRDAICRQIVANGFAPVDPVKAAPGDLVLCAPAANQFHLAVLAGRSFIHADAGHRRVVETPGRPPWPVIAAFTWLSEPAS